MATQLTRWWLAPGPVAFSILCVGFEVRESPAIEVMAINVREEKFANDNLGYHCLAEPF